MENQNEYEEFFFENMEDVYLEREQQEEKREWEDYDRRHR